MVFEPGKTHLKTRNIPVFVQAAVVFKDPTFHRLLFAVFFQAPCASPVGTSTPRKGKGWFLINLGAGEGRNWSSL